MFLKWHVITILSQLQTCIPFPITKRNNKVIINYKDITALINRGKTDNWSFIERLRSWLQLSHTSLSLDDRFIYYIIEDRRGMRFIFYPLN